jgi:hypothetical protein
MVTIKTTKFSFHLFYREQSQRHVRRAGGGGEDPATSET